MGEAKRKAAEAEARAEAQIKIGNALTDDIIACVRRAVAQGIEGHTVMSAITIAACHVAVGQRADGLEDEQFVAAYLQDVDRVLRQRIDVVRTLAGQKRKFQA